MLNFLVVIYLNFSPCFVDAFSNNTKIVGYDLSKPDYILTLPDTLHEISGLTCIDDSTVACIQDENGILFIYDVLNSSVKKQYDFHVDGDYEGIALVSRSMFILRSDGVLFEIQDYESGDSKLRTYITGIPAKNNEGLCYDSANNRLLIASKSKAGKGAELKDKRVIYGFDLVTKELSREPVFSFDTKAIKAFAEEQKLDLPFIDVDKGKRTEPAIRFFTSAIAIHPLTKKLYLLSAADHMLFVFGRKGTLEFIEQLDPGLFNKAEGITFFDNGDMLISNEGQDKKPTILRFNYSAR